eukprot:702387-Rhodomonas_salina.1
MHHSRSWEQCRRNWTHRSGCRPGGAACSSASSQSEHPPSRPSEQGLRHTCGGEEREGGRK